MQRAMADAILEAFKVAEANLPDDAPGDTRCPLLVSFRLRDLKSLKSTIEEVDRMTPHATRA